MNGEEELDLWMRDGIWNFVDDAVVAYGVDREKVLRMMRSEIDEMLGSSSG